MARAKNAAQEDILLIVPEGEVGERLARAIREAGYRSIVAHDVDQARRLIAAGLIPCLILLFLSSNDGAAEFVEEIQKSDSSLGPVVMFSTGASPELPAATGPLFSALLHLVEQHCET